MREAAISYEPFFDYVKLRGRGTIHFLFVFLFVRFFPLKGAFLVFSFTIYKNIHDYNYKPLKPMI